MPWREQKPDAVVTWFLMDEYGVVVEGSPECEPMIGMTLWDSFPHMEEPCQPFHDLAMERGCSEFLASDRGHVYFSRVVREGDGLRVTSIDLGHLTESLRHAPSAGDGPSSARARPALHVVAAQ